MLDMDQEVSRRLARAWIVDGLSEIVAGAPLLIWGIAVLVHVVWPSRATVLVAAFVPAIVGIVAASCSQRVLSALKARITTPRIGYFKPRVPSPRAKTIGTVIAGALMLAVAALVVVGWRGELDAVLPLIVGVPHGLILMGIGWRAQVWRLVALGAAFCALALALTAAGLEVWAAGGLQLTAFGVGYVGVGAIVLWRFVRAHPLPPAEGG